MGGGRAGREREGGEREGKIGGAQRLCRLGKRASFGEGCGGALAGSEFRRESGYVCVARWDAGWGIAGGRA